MVGEKNSWRCDANLEQAATVSPEDREDALSSSVLSVVIFFFPSYIGVFNHLNFGGTRSLNGNCAATWPL